MSTLASPRVASGPRIGDILLQAGLLQPDQLEDALRRQERTGERLGSILVSHGTVRRLDMQRALAQAWGLDFVDLLAERPDRAAAGDCDPRRLVTGGWFPISRTPERVVVATCEAPSGELRADIRDALGLDAEQLELRATTPLDIQRAVLDAFEDDLIELSTNDLRARHPEQSAATGLSTLQRVTLIALGLAAAAVTVCCSWEVVLALVVVVANVAFFGATAFKLVNVLAGIGVRARAPQASVERRDGELPTYTVLVPVYREANVVGDLIANLAALDYPEEKLQVLVLLEADDEETIAAARAARPPAPIRLVVVPDAAPKTKPKACNVGLFLAEGEFLVIYDAEDRPEPDQLRKAVAAFRESGETTVCVQARLRYWNASSNLLTRMFGLEYGYWFGAMLPGLDRLGLPIPLGGTSNHFRVDALRALGGWDPHNVTEDADLGLRAAVEGYRVRTIDSDTDEEACSKVRPWIRQRTRWIKGYMQTALVHSRNPWRLVREVGIVDAAGFLLLIAGTPLTFLLAPVLWVGTAAWYGFGQPHLPWVDSGFFWDVAMFDLIAGNVAMIASNMVAAVRDHGWRWAPYALLNPLYWVLHSIAAWRALVQLIRNPFYWEKTPHGLDDHVAPTVPEIGAVVAVQSVDGAPADERRADPPAPVVHGALSYADSAGVALSGAPSSNGGDSNAIVDSSAKDGGAMLR